MPRNKKIPILWLPLILYGLILMDPLSSTAFGTGRAGSHPFPALAAPNLELYGTFHAMGVIVDLDPADDPDMDAMASVAYRTGGAAFRAGFPLSRVSNSRFVGSLFWLLPGTAYEVRVTFSDPDGGPLHGTTVAGTAATRAEVVVPPAVNTYYVSPTGSGTECTVGAPGSLTQGLSKAQPGDAVILRGGAYFQGEIPLPRSGSSGAPIIIQSYPGETAIFDGGDPAAFVWTAQGGGVYRATVNASDTHLVTANGARLFPYQSLSDLQSLVWGLPGFYAGGTSVYVRLTADANPNAATMVVSRYNHAFYAAQNCVFFINLTFRHYGQGSWAKAVYFNNASDNLVQGCTFAINDLGIGIKNDSHHNVIQNNEFYDTNFGWPWDAVKAGSELETGGVRFYSPTTGRGTVIRRNTFHDYFDGLGACPGETGGATNETDVYENLIYRCGDDGLETDGSSSNVRIWGNTFHDVLVGISLAPTYLGPTYAIRNLIYRTGAGNSSFSGGPFKFNSGYGQSGPMYLFHNTGDAVLPGNNGFDIKSPGSWTLIYARNNVWSGTEYALYNDNSNQPLSLDYDDLYTTLPGELAWWSGLPDRHLNTLDELQAVTGQELHGCQQSPGFVNPSGGDYAPSVASPLIDHGLIIPGINDDYLGSGPDIGAFEVQSTVPPAPKINLKQGATNIAPGGTYGFDTKTIHTNTETVFTIENTGNADLTLSGLPLALSGANTDQFAVTVQPTSPVVPAGSTNFTLRFYPTAVGAKTAQISIANNDSDRNPYILNLTGTGGAVPTVKVDFNGDGKEDILWRHYGTGQNAVWFLGGYAATGAALADSIPQDLMALNMNQDRAPKVYREIAEVGGFPGKPVETMFFDPQEALAFNAKHGSGDIYLIQAQMAASGGPQYSTPAVGPRKQTQNVLSYSYLPSVTDGQWTIVGTGDFSGDGNIDILWRNNVTGQNAVWFMNGITNTGLAYLPTVADANWQIVGTGDFNVDGQTDILWRNNVTGQNAVWFMNGTTYVSLAYLLGASDLSWQIAGTGDFNSDGQTDILWRNISTGENVVWGMSGVTYSSYAYLPSVTDTNWRIMGTGDFNGDGKVDIIWRNSLNGQNAIWYMNGTANTGYDYLPPVTDIQWRIANR